MTGRKFYKTVLQVEVLSEGPYQPESLEQVHHDITEGDCSGEWKIVRSKELNGRQAARALLKQASDPGFFSLTKAGEDAE
jgi:hypothetical protein